MKILFIFAIISLSLFASNVYAWEPPLECADEDREMRGNRTTPCKLVLPELTEIEYRVRLDYPNCIEELVFHMPGIGSPSGKYSYADIYNIGLKIVPNDGNSPINWEIHRSAIFRWPLSDLSLREDRIVIIGDTYTFNSKINGASKFGNPSTDASHLALQLIMNNSDTSNRYVLYSNIVLRPGTNSKLSLVNSCLALLIQEKLDREHAEQLRQEEAATKAKLLAQREAELKAEEQAKREAEQQTRIAKIELQTILENKITVANTELIKTQNLAVQLDHDKTIGNLLNEIIKIKLAGDEDRAQLTNEYLVKLEASTFVFEGETGEIETRIQEYIDFNEKLFTSIVEYQANIESRVNNVRAIVDEQLQQIEQLQQEAEDLVQELAESEVNEVDDDS